MGPSGVDAVCVLLVVCPFLLYAVCEHGARRGPRTATPVVTGRPVEEMERPHDDALPVVNAHIVR